MPITLNEIACHVWAIDGYTENGANAKTVNDSYAGRANELDAPGNDADARRANLVNLINISRQSPVSDQMAKIYGGYRKPGDKAPEHMWIEYKGFIYDTMPGRDVVKVEATDKYRTCPGCENGDFGDGAVFVDIALTKSQLEYINAMQ